MEILSPFTLFLVVFATMTLLRRRRSDLRVRVLEHVRILTARGLPLGPGLVALARERGESWGRRARNEALALRGMAERADATGSLAAALATQPRHFGPELVALVRVAEAKGALPEALAQLRAEESDRGDFLDRLAERSFYPIVLVAAVVFMSCFLSVFIEPKFQALTDDLRCSSAPSYDLPVAATEALAALGAAAVAAVGAVLWGGALGALVSALGLRVAAFVPLLARPVRRLLHARWMARTGALLAAGATLPEALDDVAQSWRGPGARRLVAAAKGAREGQPLPKLLATLLDRDAGELGPPLLLEAQAKGLPAALREAGERLSSRSLRRIDALAQMARPIPIALVALVVFTHAWTVWGAILSVQDYTIRSFR